MDELSDEMLLAFADDELPAAERAAVARRLARDPLARERLAAFTTTGQWLARAYDETLHETPPAALIAAIRGGASPPAATPLARLGAWLRRPGWALAAPAGAMAGLAAGIALMLALQPAVPVGLDEEPALRAALETTPSGVPHLVELGGERVEIVPLATVRTAAGPVCREFTRTGTAPGSPAAVSYGLACRADPGDWQVVARIALATGSDGAAGFGLASGAPQALFEALLVNVGATEVLTPDAEQQLIDAGWE